MDKLIAEAGQRGIKIVLDLVPNHTSSAHAWFTDARSGRESAHRGYYVWADPGGGAPPNNWRDATGGSAWTLDDASGQYYLHNFLPSQPDLNWWDPRVHEEFREIIRFWLDRGVAGFRIDVAHGLYKDAQLRDNPPLIGGGRLDGGFGLRPVYSSHRPDTHGVYRDWRKIADGYAPQRLLLGETWMGDLGMLASYYGQNDELDLAFNFPFVFAEFSADALARGGGPDAGQAAGRRLPGMDGVQPRHQPLSHPLGRRRRAQGAPRAAGAGHPARHHDVLLRRRDRDDRCRGAQGTAQGPDDPGVGTEGRDAERTPMQWDPRRRPASPPRGSPRGSRSATTPRRNVAAQRKDPGSTLRLVRDLLALRRTAFGGQVATYERLPAPPGVWSYRSGPLLVTANFTDHPVPLPLAPGEVLLTTEPESRPGAPLGAWQALVTRSS